MQENPNSIDAYLQQALILDGEDRQQEALASLDQALKIDSTAKDVLFHKARILCDAKVYLQALPVTERLTRLYPGEGAGWRMKALSLFMIREREQAEQAINKALEIDPNDSSALTLKAGILDEMGRKGEARALLKRATEVDPHNEVAQEGRGQMQRDLNNKVAEAGLGIAGTVSRGFFVVLSEFVKEIFR